MSAQQGKHCTLIHKRRHTSNRQTRVGSVWQTTDQDHGKAAARWSICTFLKAEMTLARRKFSKIGPNASHCQVRLAQQRRETTHLAQQRHECHAAPGSLFEARQCDRATQRNARQPQLSCATVAHLKSCLFRSLFSVLRSAALPPWTQLLWSPLQSLLRLSSRDKQPCKPCCWTENALRCARQTRKLGWPSTCTRKQPSYATSGARRGNKLHVLHENERPRANDAKCQSWRR